MDNFKQKGFGLIEIILAATIAIVVFLSVESYLNFSLKVAAEDVSQTEALYLAKSLLEQARGVRDENDGWENNISSLALDSPYYFQASGTSPEKWAPVSGNQTVGKYTIWFDVSSVERDAGNGNIVASGGVIDGNTLKFTSHVSWSERSGAKHIDLFEYLTNFR